MPRYREAAVPLSRAAPGRTKRVVRGLFQPVKTLSAQTVGRYFPHPCVYTKVFIPQLPEKSKPHIDAGRKKVL